MAVQKFRSIADVKPPGDLGSPTENLRAAFALIELCHKLRPATSRRGVWRVDLAALVPDSTGAPASRQTVPT